MTNLALYKAFMPILRAAGRWLIRRLVRWGLPRVMSYLSMRIDVISDKRKRARTKRRKRWLAWRIHWRNRVARWLKKNQLILTKAAIKRLDVAYDAGLKRIPWDVSGDENFRTWAKSHI